MKGQNYGRERITVDMTFMSPFYMYNFVQAITFTCLCADLVVFRFFEKVKSSSEGFTFQISATFLSWGKR